MVGPLADQDLGIALLVLGVALTVGGFLFLPLCGVGLLLILVGALILITAREPLQYYYPVPYGFAPSPCPACGSPMAWVAQYGRWFCPHCQAYR